MLETPALPEEGRGPAQGPGRWSWPEPDPEVKGREPCLGWGLWGEEVTPVILTPGEGDELRGEGGWNGGVPGLWGGDGG